MYHSQLAYIHDRWYSDFALNAADFVQTLSFPQKGLMIDLGCGSGTFLEQFKEKEVQALGIDISSSMIALAKAKIPHFEFQVSDIFEAKLPEAKIVVAIGEILSYASAIEDNEVQIKLFFQRVFEALKAGGFLLFDVLIENAQGFNFEHFTDNKDFFIYMKSMQRDDLVTRHITSFLKQEELYSKDHEIHHQRVFEEEKLKKTLEEMGFQVNVLEDYGKFKLPPGRKAFLCQK